MHYITPDDEKSNRDFLSALGEAGFDQILEGIGDHFGLEGIICYYPSFIAVSHCSGSYPHVDARNTSGKAFNIIFPVLQANESTPELMLGEDHYGPVVIPYRYEPEAAILLGDDGELRLAFLAVGAFRMLSTPDTFFSAFFPRNNTRRSPYRTC